MSKQALKPTKSPTQWVSGVKRLVCEADHPLHSDVIFLNVFSFTFTFPVQHHGRVLSLWAVFTFPFLYVLNLIADKHVTQNIIFMLLHSVG